MPAVAGITIQATGDTGLADRLAALAGRLEDLTPAMEDIAGVLERNVHLRFDLKRDPSGRPWAALRPSTLAQLARGEVGGSLLERTRLMRGSLSAQAGPDYVVIGFGRAYAAYHEFGTRRMARRGLLTADPQAGELGAEDREDILAVLAGYLEP